LDLAANVVIVYPVAKMSDRRVCRIIRAEDVNGFLNLVRLVNVLN
jgi:hypothetical protein